jgi:GTP-binding protein
VGDRVRSPAPASTITTGEPLVVIVGYPNVGKSTLFNRLVGRREAVVDSVPGVTRDRRQAQAEWLGRTFQLVDTGGIDDSDPTPIARQVAAQAARAIADADAILLVVDAAAGLAAGDYELVDRLRSATAPVVVVANKCDGPRQEAQAHELWSLGLGDVAPISAQHGRGIGELLELVVDALPPDELGSEVEIGHRPALCIIGRPNVGKSSIMNGLLGEPRVLVHDQPGTTRDPIDTVMEFEGQEIVLIDTAGLRRRSRVAQDAERYSQQRALRAAERSDVALVVCDATEGVTDGDLIAASAAASAHCATLMVMNKWDLAQPDLDDIRDRIERKVRQRPPVEVASAETGEGLHRLIPAALRLYERANARLPTSRLNRLLRALADERPGPRSGPRQLSLRYLSQTDTSPPALRLVVNDPALMTRDYGYFLENRIRREFGLDGVPIVLDVRGRE